MTVDRSTFGGSGRVRSLLLATMLSTGGAACQEGAITKAGSGGGNARRGGGGGDDQSGEAGKGGGGGRRPMWGDASAPASTPEETCAGDRFMAERVSVDLMLLVDRSDSMYG